MEIESINLKQWLIRATTGNFLMKILSVVLGFFSTLMLARLLNPEQYGGYAYALAWVNLLVVPVVLGLDKLMIRHVSIFEANRQWSLMRGIQRFSNWIVAGFGVVVALAVFSATHLFADYIDAALIEPLRIATVLIPLIALARLRSAAMIGLHRVVQGTFPEIVLRPVLFILFILLSYSLFPGGLDAQAAVGMNICAVAISFAIGATLLRRVTPEPVKRAVSEYSPALWLRSAAPLVLLASLQIINTRVDIIMLGAMRGAVDVAIYNVVYQGAMLASFVLVAATGVISPVVARMYAQGEQQQLQRLVTTSSRAIFAATLPIVVVMILFGKPFLSLFGEQYVAGYSALLVLLTGQILNTAFGAVGVLLTMTNHGGLAAKGAAISVVVNIVLNAFLIPVWGVEGAATASMLTLFLWNIMFAFFVFQNVGISPTVVG